MGDFQNHPLGEKKTMEERKGQQHRQRTEEEKKKDKYKRISLQRLGKLISAELDTM